MTNDNLPIQDETLDGDDALLADIVNVDADAIIADRPVPDSLLAAVLGL
jgi:hypothetical protein